MSFLTTQPETLAVANVARVVADTASHAQDTVAGAAAASRGGRPQ
ncbi:hypothetical protein MM1218R_00638 [Mycobacterium marinum]|nr:hypothetical protein [Mycobacterium marinum]AXN42592.1 hypothetical protein MM1218R_00638 [Mycobacterium marinum]AXN48057.1 hypothetical protein CCUG20998_00634 [Mycobacterium marinum]EPQ72922.1 hypothetical protein MMEU_4304 [Mycobacterium marinum str. Europe]RFZ06832.1 hypothetical protein VIMS_04321 [Mycobacterium marinum]RFZ08322.1 hypothetical protein DE4381_02539 [Mycobacterium marinum]